MAKPIPDVLAERYQVDRELGRGGMATVYLARDVKHDRLVALKVLRPELGAVLGPERFLAEIQVTARLDHPHILTLIDSGEADGLLYYVLPFVRGESLRDRLTRETQLGIDETLRIAGQIAGALEYAHHQGVIHRDIKPENILLHEGEAMVADFGIALALREAGGNRLTETGLSLGTPQYMSPEQAAGDRQLDARSDLYSLGAVVYEMLAGEPPFSGPTAQAVIAKLMTERPIPLQVVRPGTPPALAAAVSRALEKTPADRFDSVAAWLRALASAAPTERPGRSPLRRWRTLAAGLLGILVLAVVALRLRFPTRVPEMAFRTQAQLTTTGNAAAPALTGDGKTVAYTVRHCAVMPCTFALVVQDVEGGQARTLLDGAAAIYFLFWSPDQRYLVFVGQIGGEAGSFLIATIGGPPRYLGAYSASFMPRGDSLILTTFAESTAQQWIRIATVEGRVTDSIPVLPAGGGIEGAIALAGGKWIIAGVVGKSGVEARVMDRHGKVTDVLTPESGYEGDPPRISDHGVWIRARLASSDRMAIVRFTLDTLTGLISRTADTAFDASIGAFDVSSDGSTIVYVEGTHLYQLWSVTLEQALGGQFTPEHQILSSTSRILGAPSPDGQRLLVLNAPAASGRDQTRVTVYSAAGGEGRDFSVAGPVQAMGWLPDGRGAAFASRSGDHVEVSIVDSTFAHAVPALAIADTLITDLETVPGGGVAWGVAGTDGFWVRRNGAAAPRHYPLQGGEALLLEFHPSADGRRMLTLGLNPTLDSILVDQVDLATGRSERWYRVPGATAAGGYSRTGSVLLGLFETSESVVLWRVTAPGKAVRLGVIPRAVERLDLTAAGDHLMVLTTEKHGDLWLSRRATPDH